MSDSLKAMTVLAVATTVLMAACGNTSDDPEPVVSAPTPLVVPQKTTTDVRGAAPAANSEQRHPSSLLDAGRQMDAAAPRPFVPPPLQADGPEPAPEAEPDPEPEEEEPQFNEEMEEDGDRVRMSVEQETRLFRSCIEDLGPDDQEHYQQCKEWYPAGTPPPPGGIYSGPLVPPPPPPP